MEQAVTFPHHDGGQLRGIDFERVARRGDGDEPGADAEHAASREPRGPGAVDRPRHDNRVSPRIFVALGLRPGKLCKP